MTNAWLNRIAANLLHLETDLRTTLREISRGGKPPRLSRNHRIEITTGEARTILHGTMPAPIAVTRLREPHARLVAALNIFRSHLVRLNDPMAMTMDQEFVLSAATALIEELKVWHRIIRWRTACRAANVKIPLPKDAVAVAVMPTMRLETAEQTFPSRELPSAQAGELDMIANRTWYPPRSIRMQQRLQPYGHQAELDLKPPLASAEVIDLRQLQLFNSENHHGKAA